MYFVQLYGQGGHFIKRTIDGGETWKIVYLDSAYAIGWDTIYNVPRLREIAYPNEKLVIAVGDSGLILRSTDKGLTWDKKRLNLDYVIYRVRMYDENIGLIQGSKYSGSTFLFSTNDGGETCIEFNKPDDFNGLWGMKYVRLNQFVGITQISELDTFKYCLVHSYNNFERWDTVTAPSSKYMTAVNENYIWTSHIKKVLDSAGWTSSKQYINRTTDGGKTWTNQRDKVYNGWGIHGITFFDKNFGIAGSGFGHAMITFDGGENWEDLELEYRPPTDGSAGLVEHIQVPSYTTAYVVFNNSKIYKYTRPTTSVAEENTNTFTLSPNPATDYIEISIPPLERGLGGVAPVVRVFDVLGIEHPVSTMSFLRKQESPVNDSSIIRLDVSHLPPGVYFVQIGSRVQRFVKI